MEDLAIEKIIKKDDFINITGKQFIEQSFSIKQIEAETISAYERLAYEYDNQEHKTTRILEQLSISAFSDLLKGYPIISEKDNVLEIGCGTGALTKCILPSIAPEAKFTFMDSSLSMLKIIWSKIVSEESQKNLTFLDNSILSNCTDGILKKFDLIICGLGDPYLIEAALKNIRKLCNKSTHIFITLPGKSWAMKERKVRLNVPSYRTRFKLKNGEYVFPFSFTYHDEDLRDLLDRCSFKILEMWTLNSNENNMDISRHKNKPFINSTLACII